MTDSNAETLGSGIEDLGKAAKVTMVCRRYSLYSISSVLALLVLWCLLTASWPGRGVLVDSLKLPSPLMVVNAAINLKWNLLSYSTVTFCRVMAGLVLGGILGVFTGLIMTRYQTISAILDPLVEALRPCPPVALIPFVILWGGLGMRGQVGLISLSTFMVMLVSTTVSVNGVDKRYVWAARSLGADIFSVYTTIIWPSIVPHLLSGLRVAAGTAFGVGVASEFLGAQGGLGFMVRNARITLSTESVLLGILLIGLESWLLDRGIRALGDRSTRWQDRPFDYLTGNH